MVDYIGAPTPSSSFIKNILLFARRKNDSKKMLTI